MTRLDTASNYQQFTAHRSLAEQAGDLLDSFEITTKVGFFPHGHDLRPQRLRAAVQAIPEELGRLPNTVLLHNPERAPGGFENACETLAELRDTGYCHAWGFSSWSPDKLATRRWVIPRPDAVMVRAGLKVPAPVLAAAEHLTSQVAARNTWGMAPFAGDASDPLWSTIDTSLFLSPDQHATRVQATVAAAFAIPPVQRLAVGTRSPAHLGEIVHAETLAISTSVVERYRALLRNRAERTHTA